MKYLLEFEFNNNIKDIYLYDDEINDITSQRLHSEFINNLALLKSDEKIDSIHILKNIKLNFDRENFVKYLKIFSVKQTNDIVDTLPIMDFFGKDIRISNALKQLFLNNAKEVTKALNINPFYFNNLIMSHNIQNENVTYDENENKFYEIGTNMTKIVRECYIKKFIKTPDDSIIFVDISKLENQYTEALKSQVANDKLIDTAIVNNIRVFDVLTNEEINCRSKYTKEKKIVPDWGVKKYQVSNKLVVTIGDVNCVEIEILYAYSVYCGYGSEFPYKHSKEEQIIKKISVGVKSNVYSTRYNYDSHIENHMRVLLSNRDNQKNSSEFDNNLVIVLHEKIDL